MKRTILFILFSVFIGLMFGWALLRSADLRCDYYLSLSEPTEMMMEVCAGGGDKR